MANVGKGGTMQIKEFKQKLKLLNGAVSTKDFLPILTNIMFDGQYMTTYNDMVGIRTTCDFPVEGAIKYKLLQNYINNSKESDSVSCDVSGTDILIKVGKSRFNFPYMSKDKFLFTFPSDYTSLPHTFLNHKFFDALEYNLLSISNNPHSPEYMGVTLEWDGDCRLNMYSTDGESITKTTVIGVDCLGNSKLILPLQFCNILKEFSGMSDLVGIYLSEGKFIIADFGEFQVFSKLLGVEAMDIESVISMFRTAMSTAPSLDISDDIVDAFGRASVLGDSVICKVTTEKDTIKFDTSVQKVGEISEDINVIGKMFSKETFNVNVGLVTKAINKFGKITFTSKATVMETINTDGSIPFIYLAANSGEV